MTGAGSLPVQSPRVNDRREGHRFSSYILPRYARRSPKVADVLTVLYLRGLSTGDFAPALSEFFGSILACRPRRLVVSLRLGATSTRRSSLGISLTTITCTCGPTVCISASGSKRIDCAVSSLSV